jgi:DNA (cytosine-5)-methyltransferase 1
MIQYGDITTLSGHDLAPVDLIVGGSPCQDLSVAGKRAGLDGARSGLFLEMIRIIREMREATNGICPRFALWENVPGAFSSNEGRDFSVVLGEFARLIEPTAPDVPVPQTGWPKAGVLLVSNGSVAWRVTDSQYWGVPQRRRRIALVADFRGQSAPEILFERKGVSGNTEPSGEKREGFTGETGGGVENASGLTNRGYYTGNIAETLRAEPHGAIPMVTQTDKAATLGADDYKEPQIVCYGVTAKGNGDAFINKEKHTSLSCGGGMPGQSYPCILSFQERSGKPGGGKGILIQEDHVGALSTLNNQMVFDSQVYHGCKEFSDGISQTVTARQFPGGNQVNAVMTMQGFGDYVESDKASSCKQRDYKDATDLVVGALNAVDYKVIKSQYAKQNKCQIQNNLVRRLTPLEAERLQGYPSKKYWDIENMTKDEYIAWNLAEGNIIADAEKGIVYGTRGPGGINYDEPKELEGTLVHGYKIYSIRNGKVKMQCRAHRVIWISRYGLIPEGYCIDHINNDKLDNRISNLQLVTPKQNSTKAAEDGLYLRGLDNPQTKLDPKLKEEIAYLYECTDLTMRKLAEMYGISKSRIGQIVKEVGWTDIPGASDSARYKAIGNSIALPFWEFLAHRFVEIGEVKTIGSLFDGIGGFPLVFQRAGAETLWTSEIEPFCQRVVETRFGCQHAE